MNTLDFSNSKDAGNAKPKNNIKRKIEDALELKMLERELSDFPYFDDLTETDENY